MSLKDKLKSIKEFLEDRNLDEKSLEYLIKNSIISHDNLYRIHFLRFNGGMVREMHDVMCDTFLLPKYLTVDESFKVISYIFDRTNFEPGSYRCCEETTRNLNRIGFILAKNPQNKDKEIVDLFSVISSDNGEMFENSKYSDKYFEWYFDGVTREEIEKIYNSHGFDISNVDVFDEPKTDQTRARR